MVNEMTRAGNLLIFGCSLMAFLGSVSIGHTTEPQVTQVVQLGGEGTGIDELIRPSGIAIHPSNGELYICDTGNNRIKVFSPYANYLRSFGGAGTAQSQFRAPQALAFDPAGAHLYVLDTGNHRVQKFSLSGQNLVFERLWGGEGNGNSQLYFPRDIAVGLDGSVYVLDSGNARIQKFSDQGGYLASIGAAEALANPNGLGLDASDNLYIADTENDRVLKLNSSGTVLLQMNSRGVSAGQFLQPRDVAVDSSGNIYVADAANYRIQKFDATGRYLQQFGVFVEFFSPESCVLAPNGLLYVVDSNTHRVQGYDVSSIISQISTGPALISPDADGLDDVFAIKFTLNEPARIGIRVYDSSGNLVTILVDDEANGTFHAAQVNEEVWNGTDSGGNPVPAGNYEIRVEAVNISGYRSPIQIFYVSIVYPVNEPAIRVTPAALRFAHTIEP